MIMTVFHDPVTLTFPDDLVSVTQICINYQTTLTLSLFYGLSLSRSLHFYINFNQSKTIKHKSYPYKLSMVEVLLFSKLMEGEGC